MFPILRILIGSVFLVSGFEKLMGPYQNFLYVIQAYQALPAWAEVLTACVFPWIELFVGLFTVLGLWSLWALRGSMVLCAVFITVVGQALIRGLPIDQCGCFGSNIHILPQHIIVFDSILLLLIVLMLRFPKQVKRLSLDLYFEK